MLVSIKKMLRTLMLKSTMVIFLIFHFFVISHSTPCCARNLNFGLHVCRIFSCVNNIDLVYCMLHIMSVCGLACGLWLKHSFIR